MIGPPSGIRVWLACGRTDMRKGMDGLAMLAQQVLNENPFGGALFAFRGRRGSLVKLLWFDGQGMCLFSKRLERGHFVWPVTDTGRVSLTPAQLSMLYQSALTLTLRATTKSRVINAVDMWRRVNVTAGWYDRSLFLARLAFRCLARNNFCLS
jgi:transposase